MQCLLDSLIYLLAIMGIIFTTITYLEIFNQKNKYCNSYRIYSNLKNKKERVDIIIKLQNADEEKEQEIVNYIKENKNINLKEIADSISIQKNKY